MKKIYALLAFFVGLTTFAPHLCAQENKELFQHALIGTGAVMIVDVIAQTVLRYKEEKALRDALNSKIDPEAEPMKREAELMRLEKVRDWRRNFATTSGLIKGGVGAVGWMATGDDFDVPGGKLIAHLISQAVSHILLNGITNNIADILLARVYGKTFLPQHDKAK